MFDDLDEILNKRKTPEVPEHLSARIIAAAARQSKGVTLSGSDFVQDILSQIQMLFPRPAYAFAVLALFIFGALIGASDNPFGFLPGVTTDDLASFMMIEDGFVAGEWV